MHKLKISENLGDPMHASKQLRIAIIGAGLGGATCAIFSSGPDSTPMFMSKHPHSRDLAPASILVRTASECSITSE